MLVGSDRIWWITMKANMKTIEWEISPVKRAGAKRRRPPVHDQSFGSTSNW
jgi:hypothetical protein